MSKKYRVRVSDVRLKPGETIKATFTLPTVRWQVDSGTHTDEQGDNDNSDESEVDDGNTKNRRDVIIHHVADKQVMFEEPSNTIHIRNAAAEVVEVAAAAADDGSSDNDVDNINEKNMMIYRQIWFEIKGDKPKYTEKEIQHKLSKSIYPSNVGTKLLFENCWCRVWDFYLEPDGGNPNEPHHHCLDYVFIYVAKGRLLGYTHDGQPGLFDSINEDCDVTYFDIPENAYLDVNYAHGGKNGYDTIPMREYLVELK